MNLGNENTPEARFEALYKAEYHGLLRYASTILLRKRGHNFMEKAEEAVQEMFVLAWEKRQKLFASENPAGWLYKALYYTISSMLKEEDQWAKRLEQVHQVCVETHIDSELELKDMVSEEDYALLKMLYVDRYTYKELCQKTGKKKSALAMKIRRIKERFREQLTED